MQIAYVVAFLLSGQTTPDEAYTAAYEQAFRSAFRTSSIEQCVLSAEAATKAGFDVIPICACVSDKLLATKSVSELNQKQANAELGTLTNECIRANPPSTRE